MNVTKRTREKGTVTRRPSRTDGPDTRRKPLVNKEAGLRFLHPRLHPENLSVVLLNIRFCYPSLNASVSFPCINPTQSSTSPGNSAKQFLSLSLRDRLHSPTAAMRRERFWVGDGLSTFYSWFNVLITPLSTRKYVCSTFSKTLHEDV